MTEDQKNNNIQRITYYMIDHVLPDIGNENPECIIHALIAAAGYVAKQNGCEKALIGAASAVQCVVSVDAIVGRERKNG